MIGVPKTSSAVDVPMSVLGDVSMLSKMAQSSWDQFCLPSKQDFKASFILQCCHSTRPFAAGWYAVVRWSLVPRAFAMISHSWIAELDYSVRCEVARHTKFGHPLQEVFVRHCLHCQIS